MDDTTTPFVGASRGDRTRSRAAASFVGSALVAIAVLLVTAGPAAAHAVLVAATPADGTDLTSAPDRVELTFNEPVEAAADALRVFDADAQRVDTGPLDTDDALLVAVGLPDDLPDGGYVVTYRVLSADSHPVAGVLSFTVGGADQVDDAVIAELFGGAGTTAAGTIGPVLRGLGYVATLLAAGMVLMATVVARADDHRRRARRIGRPAAVAGAILALLAFPVQGAATSGRSIVDAATSGQVLRDVLASGFGEGTVIRVVALLAIVLLWRRPSPALLVGLAAGGALGSYLRDGHQRTVEPAWALIGGDVVHLAAGALWFAGLVLLVVLLRTTPRDTDPTPVARFLGRFSTAALFSVAALAVSGTLMAWPLVGSLSALTSTSYGWMLLGKLGAVLAVVVVAFYNRQRLVPVVIAHAAPRGGAADTEPPAVSDAAGRTTRAWGALTTTVRLEAVIIVGVLLVTGFLVSQQPAAEEAGLRGLYSTSAPLGDDLHADVVVDPNRVGRNTVHLYVVDDTGRPSDVVSDVVFEFTYVPEGIGPIPVEPLNAGPGHWIATIDDLIFPGEWSLRIVGGADRFTELSGEVVIPVAG